MNNELTINELKALRGDVYQERENLLAAIQQGQKQVSEFNIRIGELNAQIQEALDSYLDGQIKEDLTKSMELVEDDILEMPTAKKIKDIK